MKSHDMSRRNKYFISFIQYNSHIIRKICVCKLLLLLSIGDVVNFPDGVTV